MLASLLHHIKKKSLWASSLNVSQLSLDPGWVITDARLFQGDILSPWRWPAL